MSGLPPYKAAEDDPTARRLAADLSAGADTYVRWPLKKKYRQHADDFGGKPRAAKAKR